MSDWATLIAAVITGTATIAAILIAWCLTKRGLYKYQKLQDLKKTEVRLVRNVIDTRSNFNELMFPLLITPQTQDTSSIQEDLETVLKIMNSYSGYDLLLEEIKIELTMSTPTLNKYKNRMANIFVGLLKTISTVADNNLHNKLNPYFDLISSIFKDLIQFIHTKINKKMQEIE